MRERPILMTPENAQKCCRGVKTQTRRVVRVPSWASDEDQLKLAMQRPATGIAYYADGIPVRRLTCPYGVVGDRLWVRERGWERPARTPRMLRDGADTWEPFYYDALLIPGEADELKGWGFRRRPSIYMPRWACRTVLEITDIRVERLKDISPADALAEGVFCPEVGYAQHGDRAPVLLYGFLWESINGKGSWELNPWVWVLSFRRVNA